LRLRTKAAAYGISGLILASAVILSGGALGLLNTRSSGVLSVLLTDPPSVPDGVSAIYISYSGIAVHATGFGNGGWVAVSGAGTIDTMKLINLSQTISSGVIPSLTYDLVSFSITGASVDFMGKNYSATVSAGEITVPFVGGLKVDSSTSAAALIDIQPTVLNLGTQSAPSFTLAAGAKALQVPSGDVDNTLKVVGHTFNLQGNGWFNSFRAQHSDDLSSSAPTLTANLLSFSATNAGSDQVVVRMVVVTPNAHGGGAHGDLDSVADGIVFAVGNDGSLRLLSGSPGQIGSLFEDAGYTLAPGATFHFTYSGTITNLLGGGLTNGASYYVIVIGSETLSVQTAVAS
jgi:hypothetical protein